MRALHWVTRCMKYKFSIVQGKHLDEAEVFATRMNMDYRKIMLIKKLNRL